MKFLLFGLVCAIALYSSSAATVEELLDRAESLETRAKAEVEKQRAAGKDLNVQVLEHEEIQISRLANELRHAHSNGVLGEVRLRAIALGLTLAESRLENELRRLEGSTVLVKRDLKTDLMLKATQLLTKSGPLIELLKTQGKPLLAEGLVVVENAVKTLEVKLQSIHPNSELGQFALKEVENLLKSAENKLEEEVKKLGAHLMVKRDAKTDLMLRAAQLLTKSGPLIKLLESQGKPLLAQGLVVVESAVKKLEAKLETLHPSSELGKIALKEGEELLKLAENKLEEEEKKLAGHTTSKRDVKSDLLGKAAELLTKSGGVIELLKSQGKPLLAAGVQAVEKLVKELEAKLLSLQPHTEFGQLVLKGVEGLLKVAENKLEEEVQKLGAHLMVKRDAKTDLMLKAAQLLTKSGPLIKLLESQGKPLLAQGIVLLENEVKKLETKLETLHPTSELGKIALKEGEELLKMAENKLEEEEKKLAGHTMTKRDLKTDLLGKAAELLTKSGGVVELLKSQGKPLLATGVQAVETLVKELEAKLLSLHPHTEFGQFVLKGVEGLLKVAENKLEDEIKKLSAFL